MAVAPDERTDEQKAALLKHFREQDDAMEKEATAIAESKKPLPVDPKLTELKEKLAQVSQPVPEDSILVQLRNDVEMSQKQLGDKRLTAAQDLAWALINSPAFLFNH